MSSGIPTIIFLKGNPQTLQWRQTLYEGISSGSFKGNYEFLKNFWKHTLKIYILKTY